MIPKTIEKEKAIILRKRGYTYSEILEKIPVAKSTLSRWLINVDLGKKQKQRVTEKRLLAQRKGALAKREQRIRLTEEIKNKAIKDIGKLSKRELWLIGIALYWAEGHKERIRSGSVKFSNSDPEMVKVFLKWLQEICEIPSKDIRFQIYVHETARHRLNEVIRFWLKITGFSIKNFQKIVWKKHKINTKRKNTGENYFGLLRINVRKSTNLNRKIAGWIEGICENCGVV